MIKARRHNIAISLALTNKGVSVAFANPEDEKRFPKMARAEELLAEEHLNSGYFPDPVEALLIHLRKWHWEILNYKPFPEQSPLPEEAVY